MNRFYSTKSLNYCAQIRTEFTWTVLLAEADMPKPFCELEAYRRV